MTRRLTPVSWNTSSGHWHSFVKGDIESWGYKPGRMARVERLKAKRLANNQSPITSHNSLPGLWDGKAAERIIEIFNRGLE